MVNAIWKSCRFPLLPFLVLGVPASTVSNFSHAQTAVLEEVIVVAQKREENMMDIPVALTAVSTQDLNVFGVRDTTELTKLSPSLSYDQTGLSQNSGFRIRGIGTVVYSTTAESAVAVLIDDVATSQSGQALADLSDIERVEILRGPQSTLFGRNASAGVINVITKGPTSEFEAGAELTLTDDNQEKLSAWVSGPITDAVGYRVSGYYDDLEGWVENLNPAGDTNGSKSWGINSRLEWQTTDTLNLRFQAKYDDSSSECCSGSIKYLEDPDSAAVLIFVPLTEAAPELLPFVGDDNTKISVDDLVDVESESLQLSLKAEWDVGEHTLVSITAYSDWTLDEFNELDNTCHVSRSEEELGLVSSSKRRVPSTFILLQHVDLGLNPVAWSQCSSGSKDLTSGHILPSDTAQKTTNILAGRTFVQNSSESFDLSYHRCQHVITFSNNLDRLAGTNFSKFDFPGDYRSPSFD